MPDESRAARMIARASALANVRRHQSRASSRVSPAMKLTEAPPSTTSTSKSVSCSRSPSAIGADSASIVVSRSLCIGCVISPVHLPSFEGTEDLETPDFNTEQRSQRS